MNRAAHLLGATMMLGAQAGLHDAAAARAANLGRALNRDAIKAKRAEDAKAIAGKPWKFPRITQRQRRRKAFESRRRNASL